MSKYDPLQAHLEGQPGNRVPMTFAEIEGILDFSLPPSSRTHRAWWSNNPSNNVMTKAWLAAGFETEQVDVPGERLVFRRVLKGRAGGSPPARPSGASPEPDDLREVKHPLFGALRGWITVTPGTDLTEPADPEWADLYDDEEKPA